MGVRGDRDGKAQAGIKSSAHSSLRAIALGASSLAFSALAFDAHAQQLASLDAEQTDTVTVRGVRQETQSPKYTAPLLDTPQTITVVPAEIIEQQNLLNLRDVLSTLPGITFGAGEGGGGYGDSINLRGYSANNDITVDGVRESAQYTRSDPFNLDQIEVTSGANSVYSGSGSVGGSINLVTKRPQAENDIAFGVAAGTDAYGRVTVDANQLVGDDAAFRLNVMAHQNDVPGRDVEYFHRWGVAPSFTFGINGPTQFTVLFVHQEDENIPQYGVPYALNAFHRGPLPGISPESYFGYSNVDRQETTVDGLTVILDHRFSENLSIRNLTRWQQVSQLAIVDAPQGTICLANSTNPYTGAPCAAPNTTPGTIFYTATGPRGNVRDTVNDILVSQTDLTAKFNTGGLAHTLVVGAAFSNETYHLDTGNILRNALGATPNPTLPNMSLSSPNHVYTGPLNFVRTGFTDSEIQNRAVYVFDRIEINDQWEVNGGLRYEHNEGHATVATIAVPYPAPPAQPVVTVGAPADNEDNLLSYRVGVVFKPIEAASLYAAYGNSRTPSQSTVNGACTATSATGTANCNVDPEEAVTYEIGAKYDAMGDRLQLTGSIFRNERTNFRVASGDPLVPEQQLDGSSRVDGIALGVSGLITDDWSIFANYTFLDSEILQNISDIAIGGGALDFQSGDPLPNTPEHSFSVWSTYEVARGWLVGYGATYQGEFTFNRATAASPLFYTDDYWVHRAMVAWQVTDRVGLQLNVNNLTDELYYERIRNNPTNGWATPGAARSFVLSANVRF